MENIKKHILRKMVKEEKPIIYISIEGNIGVGKSMLLDKILENYYKIITQNKDKPTTNNLTISILPEPINKWTEGEINLLEYYYKDKVQFAELFQSIVQNGYMKSFLNVMYDFLQGIKYSKLNDEKPILFIISERSPLIGIKIFTKILNKDGFIRDLFFTLYSDLIYDLKLGQQDIIIYIHDSRNEDIKNRIIKRGRQGEEYITNDFLDRVRDTHQELLEFDEKRNTNGYYLWDDKTLVIPLNNTNQAEIEKFASDFINTISETVPCPIKKEKK